MGNMKRIKLLATLLSAIIILFLMSSCSENPELKADKNLKAYVEKYDYKSNPRKIAKSLSIVGLDYSNKKYTIYIDVDSKKFLNKIKKGESTWKSKIITIIPEKVMANLKTAKASICIEFAYYDKVIINVPNEDL